MKRILTLLSGAVLCASSVFAADVTFEANGINYLVKDANSVWVTSKTPVYTGSITVPQTVSDGTTTYTVTGVNDNAMNGCGGVTAVKLPNTVTYIGGMAFNNCSNCKSMDMGTGVVTIKAFGFSCVQAPVINIPATVKTIESSAFYNCQKITSMTLPAGLTSFGERVFGSCSGLETINVAAGNTILKFQDGVLQSADGTKWYCIPSKTTIKSFVVPATVTTLSENLFANLGTKDNPIDLITIPSTITKLPYQLFYGTFVKTINIQGVPTSWGGSMFSFTYVDELNYPAGLTTMPTGLFNKPQIKRLNVPASVTKFPKGSMTGPFPGIVITSLVLNSTVPPTVETEAFNKTITVKNIYVPAASLATYQADPSWLAVVASADSIKTLDQVPTGINDACVDAAIPAIYYDLQGRQVANPQHGVFIRREGNKTTKIVK